VSYGESSRAALIRRRVLRARPSRRPCGCARDLSHRTPSLQKAIRWLRHESEPTKKGTSSPCVTQAKVPVMGGLWAQRWPALTTSWARRVGCYRCVDCEGARGRFHRNLDRKGGRRRPIMTSDRASVLTPLRVKVIALRSRGSGHFERQVLHAPGHHSFPCKKEHSCGANSRNPGNEGTRITRGPALQKPRFKSDPVKKKRLSEHSSTG